MNEQDARDFITHIRECFEKEVAKETNPNLPQFDGFHCNPAQQRAVQEMMTYFTGKLLQDKHLLNKLIEEKVDKLHDMARSFTFDLRAMEERYIELDKQTDKDNDEGDKGKADPETHARKCYELTLLADILSFIHSMRDVVKEEEFKGEEE